MNQTKLRNIFTSNTTNKRKTSSNPTSDDQMWDSRSLGANEKYVKKSKQGIEGRLDSGLGLQFL